MVFLDIQTLWGWTLLSSKPVEKKSKMWPSASGEQAGGGRSLYFLYF